LEQPQWGKSARHIQSSLNFLEISLRVWHFPTFPPSTGFTIAPDKKQSLRKNKKESLNEGK
jgi:hypothetical protein